MKFLAVAALVGSLAGAVQLTDDDKTDKQAAMAAGQALGYSRDEIKAYKAEKKLTWAELLEEAEAEQKKIEQADKKAKRKAAKRAAKKGGETAEFAQESGDEKTAKQQRKTTEGKDAARKAKKAAERGDAEGAKDAARKAQKQAEKAGEPEAAEYAKAARKAAKDGDLEESAKMARKAQKMLKEAEGAGSGSDSGPDSEDLEALFDEIAFAQDDKADKKAEKKAQAMEIGASLGMSEQEVKQYKQENGLTWGETIAAGEAEQKKRARQEKKDKAFKIGASLGMSKKDVQQYKEENGLTWGETIAAGEAEQEKRAGEAKFAEEDDTKAKKGKGKKAKKAKKGKGKSPEEEEGLKVAEDVIEVAEQEGLVSEADVKGALDEGRREMDEDIKKAEQGEMPEDPVGMFIEELAKKLIEDGIVSEEELEELAAAVEGFFDDLDDDEDAKTDAPPKKD